MWAICYNSNRKQIQVSDYVGPSVLIGKDIDL